MKRKIPIFTAICLCLLLAVSCGSFSETEYAIVSEGNISADGFIYDKYENSTVRITGTESRPILLTIPAEIDGMSVVGVADGAFADNELLLYAEFPEAELKLGSALFRNCTGLASVKLSPLTTAITDNMFDGCKNLVLIDKTENVETIGDQSFADCTFLTSFDFSAITSVGDEAFRGCTSLTSVTLPESLASIGESVFWGCSSLVRAELNCIADIAPYSFIGCSSLTRVNISASAKICDEAFRSCFALCSLTVGENVKYIGDSAFYGCDELSDITFAGDLRDIDIRDGNDALSGTGGAQ